MTLLHQNAMLSAKASQQGTGSKCDTLVDCMLQINNKEVAQFVFMGKNCNMNPQRHNQPDEFSLPRRQVRPQSGRWISLIAKSMARLVGTLRSAVPLGYEDEGGFHVGRESVHEKRSG
jgi:hypothetical protein